MTRLPLFVVLAAALASAATAAPNAEKMLERLKAADANGDGAISRDEFSAYRAGQLDRIDRDGDGFVTETDFQKIARFAPAGFEPGGMTAQFDANGDGKVSRDEFVLGPAPVFAKIDTNNDAVVTPAELEAARGALAVIKAAR